MKKFILLFFLALLSCALTLNAQTNAVPNSSGEQTSSLGESQWEYLIVSVTKFQLDLGEKEELAQRKWLDRRTGSVGFFQEAEVQREFDRLGKLGWELSGVLPSNDNNGNFVYGSSKFIFKRRFNAERAQREAELVLSEEKQRTQSLKKPIELIDLDAAEIVAQRQEIERRGETRLSQAIKNIKEIPLKITKLKATAQDNNEAVIQAELEVDGSKILLKEGNKFRTSEARNYLRKVATGIFDTIGLRQMDPNRDPFLPYVSFDNASKVQIVITVVVNSNGATRTVAQGSISGNWAEVSAQSEKAVLNFVTFN